MEEFIHKYLTYNYYIDTSDVGNDGIYEKEDTRRWKAPIDGKTLLSELSKIFSLDKDYLKTLVNQWAVNIKSDIDLTWFWEQLGASFPRVKKVVAKTMTSELVSIQPMNLPNFNSNFYITDVIYSDDTNISGESETNKAFAKFLSDYIDNHKRIKPLNRK